ncbi:MAG: type II secretion system protein GspC [Gammaproteobacteria bacterium]|nr:type II secretion system protein GspC [Gammaproteobacteria bacterium]
MTQSFNQLINQIEQLQPLLKRLPVVISIVLIIACAQQASELIWLMLDESGVEPMAIIAPANSVVNQTLNNKKSQQQDFRTLTSTHLFGIAETIKVSGSTEKMPETKLNLVLRGILTAGTTQAASAIIAQGANGREEIYGIDDKIPGGITLREIYPEHIILERQGKLETLHLEKDSSPDLISPANSSIQPISSTISTASTQELKNIRNDIIKDPTSFRKYALPVVVRENGKQIGYRLQAQQKSDLLTQAGLESSDVITSINGIKLDDMKNSIGALNELRSADQVSITVKRNGTEVPLNIQLQ